MKLCDNGKEGLKIKLRKVVRCFFPRPLNFYILIWTKKLEMTDIDRQIDRNTIQYTDNGYKES